MKKKTKKKIDKWFLLSTKKAGMFLGAWILAVILHNLIYGLFNVEEAFFFILAVIVIPLYFIICIIYTILYFTRQRKLSGK